MTNILSKDILFNNADVILNPQNLENYTPTKSTNSQFKVFMTVEKEMLLWKLIDGECNEQEERDVKRMIQINDEWRQEYESMLEMHQSFKQLLGKKRDRRIGDRDEQ